MVYISNAPAPRPRPRRASVSVAPALVSAPASASAPAPWPAQNATTNPRILMQLNRLKGQLYFYAVESTQEKLNKRVPMFRFIFAQICSYQNKLLPRICSPNRYSRVEQTSIFLSCNIQSMQFSLMIACASAEVLKINVECGLRAQCYCLRSAQFSACCGLPSVNL